MKGTQIIILALVSVLVALLLLGTRGRQQRDAGRVLTRSSGSAPAGAGSVEPINRVSAASRELSTAPTEVASPHSAPPTVASPQEEDLLARFNALPLSNKVSIYVELREAISAPVAMALANELTNSYHGQHLTSAEQDNLLAMILALGFIARQQESAYAFLKGASRLDFWRVHKTWHSPPDRSPDTERTFAGASIKGMALSGHPDAEADLENLKATMPLEELARVSGAFVDAAYHLQRIREVGYGHPVSRRGNDYHEWASSESGKRWREWKNDVRRRARGE